MSKRIYDYLEQIDTDDNKSGFNFLKIATFITLLLVASIISFVIYFL